MDTQRILATPHELRRALARSGRPADRQQPPKSYLLESLLALIFCFGPVALAAMITGNSALRRYYAGDYAAADSRSRTAARLLRWSVLLGVAVWAVLGTVWLSGSVTTPLLTFAT